MNRSSESRLSWTSNLTKRIISLGQHRVREGAERRAANIACWVQAFSGVAKNGRNLSMRFADVIPHQGRADLIYAGHSSTGPAI